MTRELVHAVELAASSLAVAVEPFANITGKRALYIRELARICSVGLCDLIHGLDGCEDDAIADTIEVLEELMGETEDAA